MAAGGSRYRFEFTRLEVAGVIVSTAASLFIVFLLGVYTGGGMSARGLADEDRVVRLPAAENATEPASEPALDDLLAGAERPAATGARPGAGEIGAAGDRHATLPDSGSVAAGRLAADPGEPLPADRDAQPPVVAANEPAAGAPHAEDAGSAAAPPTRPATEAGAVPTASPQARVAVALVPNAAARPPVQRGVWSVQVTATRDPRTADGMLRRLRAKGYDAYVVKAMRQGETFYRVRVGHFPSMEYAGQMVSRLRREPGVPEAFVASD